MAFCPNCGASLEEGAKFCTSCGMSVVPDAQPQPEPQPEPSIWDRFLNLLGLS